MRERQIEMVMGSNGISTSVKELQQMRGAKEEKRL